MQAWRSRTLSRHRQPQPERRSQRQRQAVAVVAVAVVAGAQADERPAVLRAAVLLVGLVSEVSSLALAADSLPVTEPGPESAQELVPRLMSPRQRIREASTSKA
jgi:hypothetical protein